MKTKKNQSRTHSTGKLLMILLSLCLVVAISAAVYGANTTQSDGQRLQNGSVEDNQTWTGTYNQPLQDAVPAWNTTAVDKKSSCSGKTPPPISAEWFSSRQIVRSPQS